ncbi:hypothetical protein EDC44_101154 [Cricetibacter osteomyelitidis]|uniref:Toxin VasX N-terminal region domain-containing protein n=1 Tax=Cricetibacter osteomyelitidis TaxID=1521931 RepID=A0A4R2T7U8_9PAST|nr:toxin VasX [Cricetibacter osteomyelitidis]TCP97771.1 hypothetical protein EDC44_101154 [Cricetibacter osteomyelitidis]
MSNTTKTSAINSNKVYAAPQRESVDDPIAYCQKGYHLYPVRYAFNKTGLHSMKNNRFLPHIDKANYELRRLRDGFIYIFALDGRGQGIKVTANSEKSGWCWYVYRYRSPEIDAIDTHLGSLPTNYKFKQYICHGENIYNEWSLSGSEKPYIEINNELESIYIAYSDFELPLELLDKLAIDEEIRSHWMQYLEIKSMRGHVTELTASNLKNLVTDFAPTEKYLQENENFNYEIFTPIVSPDIDISVPCEQTKGAIVALYDHIGMARDLVAFKQNLMDEYQALFQKYSYSITTAQFIDAYAKQICAKKNEKELKLIRRHANPYHSVSTTLKEVYQDLSHILAEEHIQENAGIDIVNQLKADFDLPKIDGINLINKLANIPLFHNDILHNLTYAQINFMKLPTNELRLKSLVELAKSTNSAAVANAYFLYAQALYWGMNSTPQGRKALIYAFSQLIDNNETPFLNDGDKTAMQSLAESIMPRLLELQKFVDWLSQGIDLSALNVYAYDKFITTIVTEVQASRIRAGKGEVLTIQETEIIKKIETIYRKKGITNETFNIKTAYTSQANKIDLGNGVPYQDPIIHRTKTTKLVIYDESYNLFRTSAARLSGAAHFLNLSVLLGYWSNQTSSTYAGRVANDPTLNTITALSEYIVPRSETLKSTLQLDIRTINGKPQLRAINARTGKMFNSAWLAARAGLLNFETAITGVWVLIEVGLAVEAKYKGDDIDFWGAISRGSGVAIGSLGKPAIGTSATYLAAGKTPVARMAARFLLAHGSKIPYIGLALAVLGFTLSLLKKEDMELWIENGFWGNSDEYWGEAKEGYEWTKNRQKISEFQKQFDSSFLTGSTKNAALSFFELEMQRFFAFSGVFDISATNKHQIVVKHPNITSNTKPSEIKIEMLQLYIEKLGVVHPETQHRTVNIIEGEATIQFHGKWRAIRFSGGILSFISPTKESIAMDDEDIFRIDIKVAIPRYNGTDKFISSELTPLIF